MKAKRSAEKKKRGTRITRSTYFDPGVDDKILSIAQEQRRSVAFVIADLVEKGLSLQS